MREALSTSKEIEGGQHEIKSPIFSKQNHGVNGDLRFRIPLENHRPLYHFHHPSGRPTQHRGCSAVRHDIFLKSPTTVFGTSFVEAGDDEEDGLPLFRVACMEARLALIFSHGYQGCLPMLPMTAGAEMRTTSPTHM